MSDRINDDTIVNRFKQVLTEKCLRRTSCRSMQYKHVS